MARQRVRITYENISNAAEQLMDQGIQPTIERIQNLLGASTSNIVAIANHLRAWRAEQDALANPAAGENLPQQFKENPLKDHLPQKFETIMRDFWQTLDGYAESQITVVRQESEQVIAALSEECERYKTDNQRWHENFDHLTQERDELERSKHELEQLLVSMRSDNANYIAKYEVQLQHTEELQRLHQMAQENLEHYRESYRLQRLADQEKHSEQLQQADLALQNERHELERINQERYSVQSQLNTAITEIETLQFEKASLTEHTNSLADALTILQNEHTETLRDETHWRKLYEQRQKEIDNNRAQLSESEKKIVVLTERLTAARIGTKGLKELKMSRPDISTDTVDESAKTDTPDKTNGSSRLRELMNLFVG